MAHQIVLAFFPRRCLNRFDSASTQSKFVVRDDQAIVNANHPTKPATGFAGTHCRIERKHRRDGIGVSEIAVGAMEAGGEAPD